MEARVKAAFAAAVVVLLLTAVAPFQMMRLASGLVEDMESSHERTRLLGELFTLMQDAETGQRGFVVTGDEHFLEPYHAALVGLRELRPALVRSLREDPEAAGASQRLQQLIDTKLSSLAQSIALRRAQGFEPARDLMAARQGKQHMDDIRRVVSDIGARNSVRRERLLEQQQKRSAAMAYVGLAVTVLVVLLLGYIVFLLNRIARERRLAIEALQVSQDDLKAGISSLRKRNADIALIAELARAMEVPQSSDEMFRVLETYAAQLLPGVSGALYAFGNAREQLELRAAWGADRSWSESLEPGECWALRFGKARVSGPGGELVCPHVRPQVESTGAELLCMPMVAHGEVIGLLTVTRAGGESAEASDALAAAMREQVSLSMSNMRLREELKLQSVLDPLTGLHNRRYFDETLRRELATASRSGAPLSLLMLDLDHFKRINDCCGHEAGDLVLRRVAGCLKERARNSDVVCRFGGEEFVILLPICDRSAAVVIAQELLDAVRALRFPELSQLPRPVTASAGVACFPQDAQDGEALQRLADGALYRAKETGRDRVVPAA